MSEKHTPGPWHYYEHGIEEPEDSWIEIRDEGDLIVATLPGGSIYDSALIAAAPQLLEACKLAVEAFEDPDPDLYSQAERACIAAIEAAGGES